MIRRTFFCSTLLVVVGLTSCRGGLFLKPNSKAEGGEPSLPQSSASSKNYSVEEKRSILLNSSYTASSLPYGKWEIILESPSGRISAGIGTEECEFYFLRDEVCVGPLVYPRGGKGIGKVREEPHWVESTDGKEILVLDVDEKRGLEFTGEQWKEVVVTSTLAQKRPPITIHQHCRSKARNGICYLESLIDEMTIKSRLREPLEFRLTVTFEDKQVQNEQVITVEGVADLSESADQGIIVSKEKENFVWIDFERNVAKEMELVGNRWCPINYSNVQYSPDGKWILASFNYGPSGEERGGYIQLFTSEGEFVESIAFLSDLGPQPSGGASWLPNNWITVYDFEKYRFFKFESELKTNPRQYQAVSPISPARVFLDLPTSRP